MTKITIRANETLPNPITQKIQSPFSKVMKSLENNFKKQIL